MRTMDTMMTHVAVTANAMPTAAPGDTLFVVPVKHVQGCSHCLAGELCVAHVIHVHLSRNVVGWFVY